MLTCKAARSVASWPMWFEDMEATRSSTERDMMGRWCCGAGEKESGRKRQRFKCNINGQD